VELNKKEMNYEKEIHSHRNSITIKLRIRKREKEVVDTT